MTKVASWNPKYNRGTNNWQPNIQIESLLVWETAKGTSGVFDKSELRETLKTIATHWKVQQDKRGLGVENEKSFARSNLWSNLGSINTKLTIGSLLSRQSLLWGDCWQQCPNEAEHTGELRNKAQIKDQEK
jgi:hypothetical protein